MLRSYSGAATNCPAWIYDPRTQVRPSSPVKSLPVQPGVGGECFWSQRRAKRPALLVCRSTERSCRTFRPRGSEYIVRNTPGAARQFEAVLFGQKRVPFLILLMFSKRRLSEMTCRRGTPSGNCDDALTVEYLHTRRLTEDNLR